jgi:hypothetical protein
MIEAKWLAIDPGTTTGLCWRGIHDEIGHKQLYHTEVAEQFIAWVETHYSHIPIPEVVVMESFIIHPSSMKKSRSGMHHAIELIGLVRHCCAWLGVEFIEQTPAQGKRIKNNHLKDAGMYSPGFGHANDAARHLFLYAAKQRSQP